MSQTKTSVDWNARAAAYRERVQKLNPDRFDHRQERAIWFSNHRLSKTVSALARVADFLAGLDQKQLAKPWLSEICKEIIAEIEAIEALIAGIDDQRLATDASYAGSLWRRLGQAENCADALSEHGRTAKLLLESQAKLQEKVACRQEFLSPTEPVEYFVPNENLSYGVSHEKAHFGAGQYCQIMRRTATHTLLVCESSGIGVPNDDPFWQRGTIVTV
ncbi:MAG: hypothetical protein K2W82_16950 [Candidatus Obscuribacterales bacterium]|nr:hypothetical protein [Candidatus Obscuribacterales bacterium]